MKKLLNWLPALAILFGLALTGATAGCLCLSAAKKEKADEVSAATRLMEAAAAEARARIREGGVFSPEAIKAMEAAAKSGEALATAIRESGLSVWEVLGIMLGSTLTGGGAVSLYIRQRLPKVLQQLLFPTPAAGGPYPGGPPLPGAPPLPPFPPAPPDSPPPPA